MLLQTSRRDEEGVEMQIWHCERRRKHGTSLVTIAPRSWGFEVFPPGRTYHILKETCPGPVARQRHGLLSLA